MKRRVYRIINPERLDLRMREVKMSSARLGRAAGHADHSYIARMRKGEKRAQSATRETAEAIATALAVPVGWLFEEIDTKTGRPVVTAEDVKTVDATVTQVPA